MVEALPTGDSVGVLVPVHYGAQLAGHALAVEQLGNLTCGEHEVVRMAAVHW